MYKFPDVDSSTDFPAVHRWMTPFPEFQVQVPGKFRINPAVPGSRSRPVYFSSFMANFGNVHSEPAKGWVEQVKVSERAFL